MAAFLILLTNQSFYGITELAIPSYDARLAIALGSGAVVFLILVFLLQTHGWSAIKNKPMGYLQGLFRAHGRKSRTTEERIRANSSGSWGWWGERVPRLLKGRGIVQENGKREGALSHDPGMV